MSTKSARVVGRKRRASSMRILSLGAGVQSSTLLLMATHGEIDIDRAIFADTGWEPKGVYAWLEILKREAEYYDIPLDVVSDGDLRADAMGSKRSASIPLHVMNQGSGRMVTRTVPVDEVWDEQEQDWKTVYEERTELDAPKAGMLRRQCTKEYKVRPVQRLIRSLGISRFNPVTLLIGISWDESQRMKDSYVQYVRHEYPLIEKRMTRTDCETWLHEHGYPTPPKSACIGCPYMDDARWIDMRVNRPDEWEDAVEFDAAIRHNTRIDGQAFLHRQLVPLDQVILKPRVSQSDNIDDGECGAFTCMTEGE